MLSISKDGGATSTVGILFLHFATLKKINKLPLHLVRKSIVHKWLVSSPHTPSRVWLSPSFCEAQEAPPEG